MQFSNDTFARFSLALSLFPFLVSSATRSVSRVVCHFHFIAFAPCRSVAGYSVAGSIYANGRKLIRKKMLWARKTTRQSR